MPMLCWLMSFLLRFCGAGAPSSLSLGWLLALSREGVKGGRTLVLTFGRAYNDNFQVPFLYLLILFPKQRDSAQMRA